MNFTCVLGLACIVEVEGTGLSADDMILIIGENETCGTAGPFNLELPGLLEVNPNLPVSVDGTTKQTFELGLTVSGLPQRSKLCWASAPAQPAELNLFLVEVGIFTVAGPYQNATLNCTICQHCELDLPGLDMEATDRILMIQPDGTCGDSLTMEAL